MPDPGTLALMIPLVAVTGGLMVALVGVLMQPVKIRARQHAQDEARRSYERLVLQKLDVMKTAITMGYRQDELTELDRRLERVVGSDKLRGMLDDKPQAPIISEELLDTDLMAEMNRVREETRIKTSR